MNPIAKSAPPQCLTQQPTSQDWFAFMQTQCHGLVRNGLYTEQQFLCCYCESEIDDNNGHIEHMVPRSVQSSLTYNYSNLAASCNGGTVEHCGHYKDNSHKNPNCRYDVSKFCSPCDSNTSRLFMYLTTGEVQAAEGLSPQDHEKAEYMITYLGLACPRLCGRRGSHARALITTLGNNPDPALLQWAINRYLHPDSQGKVKAYISLSKVILQQ